MSERPRAPWREGIKEVINANLNDQIGRLQEQSGTFGLVQQPKWDDQHLIHDRLKIACQELLPIVFKLREHDSIAKLRVGSNYPSAELDRRTVKPQPALDVRSLGQGKTQLQVAAAST
jgi:hypothetical protein